jgi:hypothetical protein
VVGIFVWSIDDEKINSFGDLAIFVHGSIYISDLDWLIQDTCWKIELVDYSRGYEIVCSATVDQGIYFGS